GSRGAHPPDAEASAVAVGVEEERASVPGPGWRAVHPAGGGQAPGLPAVEAHEVDLRLVRRRLAGVAIAAEGDGRAVGRDGGPEIAGAAARQVAGLARGTWIAGTKRHPVDVGVAVAVADEHERATVRREAGRPVEERAAREREIRPRLAEVASVEVRSSRSLGHEDDPAAVGREGRVVAERGVPGDGARGVAG